MSDVSTRFQQNAVPSECDNWSRISELCKADSGTEVLGEMEWGFERDVTQLIHSCYMVVIIYILKRMSEVVWSDIPCKMIRQIFR